MRTSLPEKAYTLTCKSGYGARASSARSQTKAWPGPGPPTFCSEHSTKGSRSGADCPNLTKSETNPGEAAVPHLVWLPWR